MTTRNETTHDLVGRTVYSSDGDKLGTIDDLHADADGGGRYIEITTGWFGRKRHAVPVDAITMDGDDVRIPYTKEQIEAAPTLEEDEHLDYDRERMMGSHYGYAVRDWDETRDAWLDRDLTRGPTPETRGDFHDHGGTLDQSDGPTPETRRAMAETSERIDPDQRQVHLEDDSAHSTARVRYLRISRRI